MPINPNQSRNFLKVKRMQRNINSSPRFQGLIEVFEDSKGAIKFRTSFDGNVYDDIETATGNIEASGINTYRVFGPNPIGSAKGLNQIAEEQVQINRRLKALTPAQQDALRKLGLGHVIGQGDISIEYLKYDLGKGDRAAKKLKEIRESKSVKGTALLSPTDDSVTAMNYRIGDTLLNEKEATQLRYFLGIGTLTDKFIGKITGEIGQDLNFSPMAKLSKRIQSMLSERDVALSGDFFTTVLGITTDPKTGVTNLDQSKIYKFDDVSAFIRAMLGGQTTEAERFLLTAGLEIDQTAKSIESIVKDASGSNSVFRDALEKLFIQTAFDDQDDIQKIFGFMQTQFAAANQNFEVFQSQLKAIKEGATTQQEAEMANRLLAGFKGIEQMRDGEFIGDVKLLDFFINDLESQKAQILSGKTGGLTPEDVSSIKDIENTIESLRVAQKNGLQDMDSVIARLNLPGMQGKGEMFLRFLKKFENIMPDELKDKLLVLPQSAIKTEVQGVPSLLLNISKTHAPNVYMDPFMLMFHQDYFGTPEFMQSMNKNVTHQLGKIDNFMQTGVLEEEVQRTIFRQIEQEIKMDDLLPDMNAAARSSYLRNRAEAKEIRALMNSGVDPRQIPAFIRRVTEFYSQNAFRMKEQRVDLVMPDTFRAALRTQQSSGPMFESAMPVHRKSMIRLDDIADNTFVGFDDKSAIRSMLGGASEAEINMVNFRLSEGGNRMILNGAAAHLYHHSLGTFDLDDKGVPIMTTFKDANGNDRLAFMTMRQPTGYQEKIFMQADLAHEHTLKSILNTGTSDWAGLLNDNNVISNVRYTIAQNNPNLRGSRVDEIIDLLRQAKGNTKGLRFKDITSEEIEAVLVALRQNASATDDYNFSSLMKITDRDLLEMAAKGSASPLGINQRIATIGPAGVSQFESFRSSLAARGIDVDSMPQYSTGNFITMLTEEQAKADTDDFLQFMSRETGQTFRTKDDISAYYKATQQGSIERIQYNTAFELYSRRVQQQAGEQIGGALGGYMNRQSAAALMDAQVKNALASLEAAGVKAIQGYDLAEFYFSQYAIGIIPPSSAVDIDKAVAGKMVAQQENMVKFAQAIDSMRASGQDISEQAVRRILSQLTDIGDVTLDEMGMHTIKTMGESIGFLRAKQLAAGIAADQAIGVDTALFGSGSFGRIKGRDVATTLESVLVGAQKALATAETQAEADAIQSFIDQYSSLSVSDRLASIALTQDSQFRVLGRYVEAAEKVRERFEGKSALAQKSARNSNKVLQAIEQAKYVNQVDAVIESQAANIEEVIRTSTEINEKLTAGESADNLMLRLRNIQDETATTIYQAMTRITQTDAGANILDIYDTIEARLGVAFRGHSALKALSGVVDIEGREDLMAEMFEIRDAALDRRQFKATLRNTSYDSYQDVLNELRMGGLNISKIDLQDPNTVQLLKDISEKRKLESRIQRYQKLVDLRQQQVDAIDPTKGYTKLLGKRAKQLSKAQASLQAAQQAYSAVSGAYDTDLLYDFSRVALKEGEITLGADTTVSRTAQEAALRTRAAMGLERIELAYGGGQFPPLTPALDESEIDDTIIRTLQEAEAPPVDVADSPTRYTRFENWRKSQAILDVLDDKLVRRSAFAVAGLAVFGLVYSAAKERSQDDISGPPLLPGGSAYESDYPRQLPSISDLKYLNPTTLGMQYKINTYGSEDQLAKLQMLVGSVVDGPIDSTMYNGLPSLGRDPYGSVASSF